MTLTRRILLLTAFCCLAAATLAQRSYKNSSVLASGNWFRISVKQAGVYKMDAAFLSKLGFPASIPSAQMRVYGTDGSMLPEANNAPRIDDLEENAILVEDGGDGVLNGSDYVLFYAEGPNHWLKDSTNRRFSHQLNLYSNKSYYYVTVGGIGLRVPTQTGSLSPATTVTSFDEHYFHELDTVNFLSSGKQWFGEELSGFPGRTLARSFSLPLDHLISANATIITNMAARSVNTPATIKVDVNRQPVQDIAVPAIGSTQYDLFAQQKQQSDNFLLNGSTATVDFSYTQGSFNSQSWINWFEFFARKELRMSEGKQLLFRDWNSTANSAAEFIISDARSDAQVWDVTDPFHPEKMKTTFSSGQLRFVNDVQRLREYVCFNDALTPEMEGAVPNQNLHASEEKDLIIVTAPALLPEAQRLAQFHTQRHGLRTIVATTDEVYNEFSGGSPDPTAIRDFVKMFYDRYRDNWPGGGKYLLLFGKASFDYKNRLEPNTNLVPAFESTNSLDPLSTYTSDDFFGFLDDDENIESGSATDDLDIGVGRIPANNLAEAKNFVDKVMDYHELEAFGPWRNNLNFIADDEDNNLHLQDAETLTATASNTAPVFNQQKIYLDAFLQESGSVGGRYPQANAVINSNIYNGTLIWNYTGHGGSQSLAEEVVLDRDIVNNWSNRYRLPLFVTATCDFAPYDNPTANSLGENLLLRPKTGAIALMTTTRVVFAFSNRILNNNYLKFALERDANGRYRTLGQAMMTGKNYTYQTSGDVINNRKFTLLGDPAMRLAFPENDVVITAVNGKPVAEADTLSAMETVVMDGEVRDGGGNVLTNFQGTAYLSLFDKLQNITTLGNDATSQPVSFPDQENVLFKGKASVQKGKFSFRFKIPKDINYQFGKGKISLYAQDGNVDGNGYSRQVIIGGISSDVNDDAEGPGIKAYLNSDRFVNGSITNANPILLVKLSDSSGINTGGSGIDHDIVATLDNDPNQYFVLNNYYEAELDSYQKGSVRFQLPEMTPGTHTLKIKAWDVMNNSSEYSLDFSVAENAEFRVQHVLNYPNPFTTSTHFWFEHNRPGTDLQVKVEIFTISGKLIKTISQTINTTGNRSNEIEWNASDEYGQKLAKGVYIYRLRVKTTDGKTATKWERLVILGK